MRTHFFIHQYIIMLKELQHEKQGMPCQASEHGYTYTNKSHTFYTVRHTMSTVFSFFIGSYIFFGEKCKISCAESTNSVPFATNFPEAVPGTNDIGYL